MIMFSFDCEKNQVLPKVPDQAAYYSRQFYIYNFTVVKGHSKGKIDSSTVTRYCWTENQFNKGSNEIASCVYYTLQHATLDNINTIRLVCDGCGDQNKNTTLIGMCGKWLSSQNNVKSIELVYPVRGHSFIPPDRVFGLHEQAIKKREIILTPEEYLEIFEPHSTVLKLGDDVPNLDWKKEISETLKLPGSWHFQFSRSKRFFLSKGIIS